MLEDQMHQQLRVEEKAAAEVRTWQRKFDQSHQDMIQARHRAGARALISAKRQSADGIANRQAARQQEALQAQIMRQKQVVVALDAERGLLIRDLDSSKEELSRAFDE